MSDDQITLETGMDVYDAAGQHVGTVTDTAPDYVVVGGGGFFSSDAYVPLDAIEGVTRDRKIYLLDTADAATGRGWDRMPASTSRATGTATDAIRVPVYEEDLSAVKREVARGAVRIEKDVVTEDRVVEVPLTEERVRVSRVEGGAGVTADASHAFEEGVIEVPLRGQEVELEKTARVAGEVVVEKEAVQRTERVGGTVRREEVRVDEDVIDGELSQR